MMTWPCCSELLRMDPAELAVFFPFLFLELPNPNLWPAEGAGPTLNLPENGHGYPPRLKVAEAVASLHALLLKIFIFFTYLDVSVLELIQGTQLYIIAVKVFKT